ncbi:DUF1353 domain-containing protein [Arundinibacter roseus]|uniref:DUF1353 domain-containing protein n=1 Tax=Arundinibacter roseus TaxID=2070510 RepID=A0A4R4KA30_9BACT|nr:DUF1353 domain-containing protein [Arundinibacter roseus]TDB64393.1 DUF1353 domain-containing protein [Arundinibacter roseus]
MTHYPDIRFRKDIDNSKLDMFVVVEPCRVEIVGPRLSLVIPYGYKTDFASVPQWLWSIVPPHGRMTNAAVVHDFMYDNRVFETYLGPELARAFADRIFLRNMLASGVKPAQARMFYWAVRMFGARWWRE